MLLQSVCRGTFSETVIDLSPGNTRFEDSEVVIRTLNHTRPLIFMIGIIAAI